VPPFEGVAVNVTNCPTQISVLFVLIEIAGVTDGETSIVILFEFAVVVVTQGALLTMVQLTTSLSTKVLVTKGEGPVKIVLPFTFQFKTGLLPPLLVLAVKLTDWPLHTLVEEVLIEIVGLAVVETFIVMPLLVSGVFPQGKLPVSTQVMMSPLESAVVL
jgi:hypothetical protein